MAGVSTCSAYAVERSSEGQGHEMKFWCPDSLSWNFNVTGDFFRPSPNSARNGKDWVRRQIYNVTDITGLANKDNARIDQVR